jgi:hypothetical protein
MKSSEYDLLGHLSNHYETCCCTAAGQLGSWKAALCAGEAANVLPMYCQSTANVLPMYCNSVALPLAMAELPCCLVSTDAPAALSAVSAVLHCTALHCTALHHLSSCQVWLRTIGNQQPFFCSCPVGVDGLLQRSWWLDIAQQVLLLVWCSSCNRQKLLKVLLLHSLSSCLQLRQLLQEVNCMTHCTPSASSVH